MQKVKAKEQPFRWGIEKGKRAGLMIGSPAVVWFRLFELYKLLRWDICVMRARSAMRCSTVQYQYVCMYALLKCLGWRSLAFKRLRQKNLWFPGSLIIMVLSIVDESANGCSGLAYHHVGYRISAVCACRGLVKAMAGARLQSSPLLWLRES